MKFKRINAHFRHVDKELTFSLDLISGQANGQSIDEWQHTLSEITKIHLKYVNEWYLSYFVSMDVTEPC